MLTKLPNRPTTSLESVQIQLILNDNSSLNLLVGANNNYVTKATQAIKDTMLGSPAEHAIKTIEYLNANNAILNKMNTQLVAASRSRQQAKKGKKTLGKARSLSKEDVDKMRKEAEAKEAAEIAHKAAMEQKKKEQALKKAQKEADKAERAFQRAQAKDTCETHAEMARLGRIKQCLFT